MKREALPALSCSSSSSHLTTPAWAPLLERTSQTNPFQISDPEKPREDKSLTVCTSHYIVEWFVVQWYNRNHFLFSSKRIFERGEALIYMRWWSQDHLLIPSVVPKAFHTLWRLCGVVRMMSLKTSKEKSWISTIHKQVPQREEVGDMKMWAWLCAHSAGWKAIDFTPWITHRDTTSDMWCWYENLTNIDESTIVRM